VKRNNNNSEGVDGNEQRSSNVKEVSNPQRTNSTSTVKVRKWDDIYLTVMESRDSVSVSSFSSRDFA